MPKEQNKMCKVSDKIKLCSCSTDIEDVYELDNYWIFYRFKPRFSIKNTETIKYL
jgi:hypothetical protein